jgi:NTE family protein
VARRHRFVEEIAGLPSSVRVHVLPSGEDSLPLISLRQRGGDRVASRIERGYQASMTYLSSVAGVDAPPTAARASG